MIQLSIIIVGYKNMQCLQRCLDSIPLLYWVEIIVVNNTHQNRGFGAACNLGAELSRGTHLFFLNSDAQVSESSLIELLQIITTNIDIGILGPKLINREGQAYLSCSMQPNRVTMPIVYSILNRLFQKAPFIQDYWYTGVPPIQDTKVGGVSGAALLISKNLFNEVGRFDEHLFLYWEELDLARRVNMKGFSVLFTPNVTIIHEGGLSTAQNTISAQKWFNESRYYFMKKYFGFAYAILAEAWFTFLQEWRLLLLILALLILSLYYFIQFNWFTLTQALAWNMSYQKVGVAIENSFWLGVIGSIMLTIGFYNEANKLGKLTKHIISFFIGLVLIWLSPLSGIITILGGIGWVLLDLLKVNSIWRRLIVESALFAVIILMALFSMKPNYSAVRVPAHEWHALARYMFVNKIVFSDIRCVGCQNKSDLIILSNWLNDMGLTRTKNASLIYISLPPYSKTDYGIANTIRYSFGTIRLELPL